MLHHPYAILIRCSAALALAVGCTSAPASVVPPTPSEASPATPTTAPVYPAARGYSRMVYDDASGRVWLFAGFATFAMNTDLWDTWAFDPQTSRWSLEDQRDAFFLPFNFDSLALDRQSGKVIVYTSFWQDNG